MSSTDDSTDQPTPAGEPPKRRGRPPSGGREAILDATLELLRERGIANLTSREVAARAGVSDASVYYHFHDRVGLIEAAFEHGLRPLRLVQTEIGQSDAPPAEVLPAAFASLMRFYITVMPILNAAQSDDELRRILSDYMQKNDLGPHNGVRTLGAYLRRAQAAGHVREDVAVDAVALLLMDCAFARASRAGVSASEADKLPSSEAQLTEIIRLL